MSVDLSATKVVQLLQDAVLGPAQTEEHPEDGKRKRLTDETFDLLVHVDPTIGPEQNQRRVLGGVRLDPVDDVLHHLGLIVAPTGTQLVLHVPRDVIVHVAQADRLRSDRIVREEPDLHLVVIVQHVGDRDDPLERPLHDPLTEQAVHRTAGIDDKNNPCHDTVERVLDQYDGDLVLTQVELRHACGGLGQVVDRTRTQLRLRVLESRRSHGDWRSVLDGGLLSGDFDAVIVQDASETRGVALRDVLQLELSVVQVDLRDEEAGLNRRTTEVERRHDVAVVVAEIDLQVLHITERLAAAVLLVDGQRDHQSGDVSTPLSGVDLDRVALTAAFERRRIPPDALPRGVIEEDEVVVRADLLAVEQQGHHVRPDTVAVLDAHGQRSVGQRHVRALHEGPSHLEYILLCE